MLIALTAALSVCGVGAPDPGLKKIVAVGASLVLSGSGISQVAVSDPTVVDVQPVSTSEVLVVGLTPGTSQVLVWDLYGRRQYDITVLAAKAGIEIFANLINSAISTPGVTTEAVGDRVLLRGNVQSEEEMRRCEAVAKAIYPQVENLLVVRPGSSPATLEAINQALSAYQVSAEAMPDGKILVKGSVESPVALAALRKALDPWAKEASFVFDVQTVKTPQQEAIEALTAALAKWDITASALADGRVLLEGTVPTSEALDEFGGIIDDWPEEVGIVPRVSVADATGAKQVLIRARVVDIERRDLKDLGVDWSRIVFSEETTTGERTYTAEDQPFIIGQSSPGPFPLFGGPPITQLDAIGARINALIQKQKARLLSQPTLVTASGRPANILIGGEIPVPVPQSGVGAAAVITIEYKPYGISLKVLPTVAEDGEIAMLVAPEVSTLDYANAVVLSGTVVPAFKTRRAESTVHVPSGCSIAIGGLIGKEMTRNVKEIPLLSKIPILGNFFKSVSTQQRDAELVIIVTPVLVGAPGYEQILTDEGPFVPDIEDRPRPEPSCAP